MIDINKVRAETLGLGEKIHLNNAGASFVPFQVSKALHDYLHEEERIGGYELEELRLTILNEFYTEAAKLLHAKPRNIAFGNSATDAFIKALSTIDFKKGDVILTSKRDYSSNHIQFISIAKRLGAKLIIIEEDAHGDIDMKDCQNKIEQYNPRLVSITHVPTNTGAVQDIKTIGAMVKDLDCIYIVDACQSLGQMEVNVNELHCDYLSGTFRKFMRGPRGSGLLYVSDRQLALETEPLYMDSTGATWLSENEYKAHDGARKFEYFEYNMGVKMASIEALKYINHLGIDQIYSRNQELLKHAIHNIDHLKKVKRLEHASQLCNIVTVHIDGFDPIKAKKHFLSLGINISLATKGSGVLDFNSKGVNWAIRMSPHYYNTHEEIDSFVAALEELTKV